MIHAFPTEPTSHHGMSLRDYFAGQAIVGLIAAADNADNWSWRTGTLTGDAYMFADEMLEARKVKP